MTGRAKRRLSALEASSPPAERKAHRFILEPGQSLDEVLDAYGRDRIAEDDIVIVREIVERCCPSE